jgi:putative transposase
MRWRTSHKTVGYGPLYQGRFKNFPIQQDDHLLTVLRYVERNPLASEIVKQAQDWPWSSLWVRRQGTEEQKSLLAPWPLERPADWVTRVNRPMTAKELAAMEQCFKRSSPMGDEQWVRQTADKMGLKHTLRPEGRQKRPPDDGN